MVISDYFGTENYVSRLYIVQNVCGFYQFFLHNFLAPKRSDTPKLYFFILIILLQGRYCITCWLRLLSQYISSVYFYIPLRTVIT